MRGVLGLLLVVVGLEIGYLVLAGKLPLKLKTEGGKGGGPAEAPALDSRLLAYYSTPRSHPYVGLPVPKFGGLV